MSNLTAEEAIDLATHIARHIFDLGVTNLGNRPHRVEYKVQSSGAEVGVGGLNESAMRKFIADAISTWPERR